MENLYNGTCQGTSTRSWEPPTKRENFDVEYCPLATLKYDLTLDKTVKKKSHKIENASSICRMDILVQISKGTP